MNRREVVYLVHYRFQDEWVAYSRRTSVRGAAAAADELREAGYTPQIVRRTTTWRVVDSAEPR